MTHTHKVILLWLGLVVTTMVICATIYYAQNSQTPAQKQTSKPVQENPDLKGVVAKIASPPPINGKNWQEITDATEKNYLGYVRIGGDTGAKVFLPGHLWKIDLDGLQSMNEVSAVISEFGKYLNSIHFDANATNVGGMIAMSGWGPSSSIDSSIYLNGNKIHLVSYEEVRELPSDEPGGDIKCPCSLGYELFISDEVTPTL